MEAEKAAQRADHEAEQLRMKQATEVRRGPRPGRPRVQCVRRLPVCPPPAAICLRSRLLVGPCSPLPLFASLSRSFYSGVAAAVAATSLCAVVCSRALTLRMQAERQRVLRAQEQERDRLEAEHTEREQELLLELSVRVSPITRVHARIAVACRAPAPRPRAGSSAALPRDGWSLSVRATSSCAGVRAVPEQVPRGGSAKVFSTGARARTHGEGVLRRR